MEMEDVSEWKKNDNQINAKVIYFISAEWMWEVRPKVILPLSH